MVPGMMQAVNRAKKRMKCAMVNVSMNRPFDRRCKEDGQRRSEAGRRIPSESAAWQTARKQDGSGPNDCHEDKHAGDAPSMD